MKLLFKNKHAETMELDQNLTIKDLVRMGITSIRLFNEDQVRELPEGWWVNVEFTKPK
jgi:hypothetical protein